MAYDYLSWDAQSIQELLRRKLLETGLLTDQLYPSSDTKILIDLFAWVFDVLTYMLNNSTSDLLFADTQLYENMNRLVKLLSYSPRGYTSAQVESQIQINYESNNTINSGIYTIPKYAFIELYGKTDKYGHPIRYSFVEDFSFNVYTNNLLSIVVTPVKWPVLVNGFFERYNESLYSDGIPYETFTLRGLNPANVVNPTILDHNNFNVFVKHINSDTGESIITEYKQVNNLILDADYNTCAYELRLNEYKNYTIKFGDNIHGKRLDFGDEIYIVYLRSNGEDGKVDVGELKTSNLKLNIHGFDNTDEMMNVCFGGIDTFKQYYSAVFIKNGIFIETINNFLFSNLTVSSDPVNFESVEEIRENAPTLYKMGGRLITANDFKTYIMTKYKSQVIDIYVCNNFEYMSIFYKWLKQYNKLNVEIRKYNYMFTDACDFNNIYLWMLSSYGEQLSLTDKSNIVSECKRSSCVTAELVPADPIKVTFVPFVKHPDLSLEFERITNAWQTPCKIIIVKKPNTFINDTQLKSQVNEIFVNYFDLKNQRLGNIINVDQLEKQIYELSGVELIKTRYIPSIKFSNYLPFETTGLSLACWTQTIIEAADFDIFNHSKKLLAFQYATLYRNSIEDLIEIEYLN